MSDVLGNGGILKEVVQAGDGPPVPHNASVLSTARDCAPKHINAFEKNILFI